MTDIPEIIKSCLQGNELSYKDLYDETNKLAFYHAQMLLKDRDDIMNAVQTSYVKIFKNLHTLDNHESFNSWLKTIVRNTSIDIIRKNKDLNFSEISYEDSLDFEVEDQRPDSRPDVVAVEQDVKGLLYKILYKLPEDQRICVSMFYFDQLTTKEIAEELNISENSVKSRLKYARDKIKVEVLDLEKKGTKIYGLAPIPFLYFLYKESIKTYKISPKVSGAIFESVKISNPAPKPLPKSTIAKAAKASAAKKIIAGLTATAVLGTGGYYAYDTYIAKDNAFSNNLIQRSNDPIQIIHEAIYLTTQATSLDFDLNFSVDSTVNILIPIKVNFKSNERVQFKNLDKPEEFEFSIVPTYDSKIAGFDLSSFNFIFGGLTQHYSNYEHALQELPTPFFNENPEIAYVTTRPEVMLRSFYSNDYLNFLAPISADKLQDISIKETKTHIEISYKQSLQESNLFQDVIEDEYFNTSDLVAVRYLIDQEGHISSYSLDFESGSKPGSFIKANADLNLQFNILNKGNNVIVEYPFD